MMNKEKIAKVNIYKGEKLLVSSKVFSFPKVMLKLKKQDKIEVKFNSLPMVKMGDSITVIFDCFNGDRIKCSSKVDKLTASSMEFLVGEGEVLEERRRFFKVKTNEAAYVSMIERKSGKCRLDEDIKVNIIDINLGGVMIYTKYDFEPSEIITLRMFSGEDEIEVRTEILRRQLNQQGVFVGFGCRFVETTAQEEEALSRHILECQVAERERRLALEEMAAMQ